MSHYYYVVDKNAKTFYCLGKGSWYIMNQDKEIFQDQEYLSLFIIEDVYGIENDGDDEFSNNQKQYIKERIVPDLFKAFNKSNPKDLVIISDAYDDLTIMKSKRYVCVGTRYNEIDSDRHKEDIAYYNRQNSGDPLYERLYDPEQMKQYPEWEIY